MAAALNNLAGLYRNQGRYAEAEPLYKRALAIHEKALGPDHPDVATALNNLAELYRYQGRYAEAEPLYKRSLAIVEKALGPDHPDVAKALNNLAELYHEQDRYADAEPLYKRSLRIFEKALGPDHPDVEIPLNKLEVLYSDQRRYGEALPLIRRTVAHKTAATWALLPVLFGAQAEKLIPADEAVDDGLNVVQRALRTSAGEALNALAARFSAGGGRLAELVRKDQDLANEAAALDKAIIAAVSKEPSRRDAAAEQKIKDRIAAITQERDDLGKVFAREFPDYAALSRPEPLTVKDIQPLLAEDEALVVVDLGAKKLRLGDHPEGGKLEAACGHRDGGLQGSRGPAHTARFLQRQAVRCAGKLRSLSRNPGAGRKHTPRKTTPEPRGQWRTDKSAAAAPGPARSHRQGAKGRGLADPYVCRHGAAIGRELEGVAW